MPAPTQQLLSRTSYAGDGVTLDWNFTFASGYIDKAHVKAYTASSTGVRTEIPVIEAMFTGPYQLHITPAIAVGLTLTIYRDTPKDAPLVDFVEGSNLTEESLDTLALQAVMIGAESTDNLNQVVGPEFQATAAQVAASAASAAASAASALASKNLAQGAASTAASQAAASTSASLIASVQPYVNLAHSYSDLAATAATNASVSEGAASAAAVAANGSKVLTDAAVATVSGIAGALSGSFGFTNAAYDFGFVTDTTTYLNLDCGVLP